MQILDKIIARKRQEVAGRRERYPVRLLEESLYYQGPTVSLSHYVRRKDKSGIIAEFKRRSPSQQNINLYAEVEQVSIGYMQAGASALSILTDEHFFGGSNQDLQQARRFNYCPILRKDFVIDEYQIVEARSIGADAVLLIAACLTAEEVDRLARFARSLDLEVLLEVHDRSELDKLSPAVNAVGVNNRNLQNFEVSLQTSFELAAHIPAEMVRISESGIEDPQSIVDLRQAGFDGFLIGTYFMRDSQPAQRCREFIQRVDRLEQLLQGAIA